MIYPITSIFHSNLFKNFSLSVRPFLPQIDYHQMEFAPITTTTCLHFAFECCQKSTKFHNCWCDAIEYEYIFNCECHLLAGFYILDNNKLIYMLLSPSSYSESIHLWWCCAKLFKSTEWQYICVSVLPGCTRISKQYYWMYMHVCVLYNF